MNAIVWRGFIAVGLGVVVAYVGTVMNESGSDQGTLVLVIGLVAIALGAITLVQERVKSGRTASDSRRPWDRD